VQPPFQPSARVCEGHEAWGRAERQFSHFARSMCGPTAAVWGDADESSTNDYDSVFW